MPPSSGPHGRGDRPPQEGALRKSSASGYSNAACAALGLRGDVNEARAILAEALKIKLWFKSIAQLHADAPPYMNNPQFAALREKTTEIGLRRAGMPEE